jgi:hypothetical protein
VDSLTHGEREDRAQGRGREHQLRARPFLDSVRQQDANQPTETDGGQGIGHTIEPAAGAPMVIGKSPHALGTSSHA